LANFSFGLTGRRGAAVVEAAGAATGANVLSTVFKEKLTGRLTVVSAD